METFSPQHPIGIFDSGMGGLTVTKTIAEWMPNEHLIYFGDTAHTPWGDKSLAAIQAYSVKICDFLLEHHCKYIVIACHTASAAAFDLVQEYVGNRTRVLNVIDPVVQHIGKHHANKKIGLIGTKQTIRSNTYKRRLDSLQRNIELCSLATPLLVPLIEEGFLHTPISEMVLSEYLNHPELLEIQALILGCTHYPLMKSYIQNHYQNKIDIIDASEIIAQTLKEELRLHKLLNQTEKPNRKFYVSDHTDFFKQTTQLFFQEEIELLAYPLWGTA